MLKTSGFRVTIGTLCAVLLVLLIVPVALSQTAKPVIRIGVYDSRAIAVAYVRTHPPAIGKLIAERDAAKAAGDQKRVAEIEAQGKAQQERLHQQAFSTASVTNLLEAIKADIPAVAKEAGVVLIVSKWETLNRDPSVEYVDVTMPLVMKFNPDARVLKVVEELVKQPPIPMDQLPPDAE